ncbi:translational GTPase TypA [Candidatus Woesebacteria bacterium]|nr:translational GTPase TypA [Candidatus Woesebacteria bacterium]
MQIRNIAIIAHVDHGKTTLVDGMLKQTHTFRDNQAEMQQTTILDSNELERERGITILAKNTAVQYHDTKINIIDTPGHADFSGEVERVINMADGALLIVDAAEGPLPQTRFVLERALDNRLKVVVVINKIDRKDADVKRVINQVEELFLLLARTAEDLHFKILYSVGRDGKVWTELPGDASDPGSLDPLFETIVNTIPAPQTEADKPFKMLVSNIDFDAFKGTYAIGKVLQGKIKTGATVSVMADKDFVSSQQVKGVFASQGLGRVEVQESTPGDIIAITGIANVQIGQTLCDPSDPVGMPMMLVTEPTLRIVISNNTSPLGGKEGQFCTIRQVEERLQRELKTNIGLRLAQNTQGNGFIVSGRGELHLAILIETMRREGYELEVSKPQVIFKSVDGVMSEPNEELTVEIDQQFVGIISEELGKRRAELLDTFTNDRGISRMVYKISSNNLLGFRSKILSKTRGNGLFATRFIGYEPQGTSARQLRNGALIATEVGQVTAYALEPAQHHGDTFVTPGDMVYEGMVVGLNNRQEDIDLNVCKLKKSTNVRAASADMGIQLAPAVQMSLEQCLDFIEDDELLEVTPLSLRLRKRVLQKTLRK